MANDMQWRALAERVGEYGEELCEAMKELYAVFGPEIVDWYASLYDAEHGMWYHSRSGQLGAQFLPDIESMCDTMGFLAEMGAFGDKPWYEVLPDWLKKRTGDFIYNLQDEDGYFYHPQWGKDIHNLRKSRDLGTCTRFLKYLGVTPKYKIPGADEPEPGEAEAYDISKAPVHFQTVENFKNYLYGMNFDTRSYNCGSEISSEMGEIEYYGKMLGVDFVDMTMKHLAEKQREDNGIWHPTVDYYGGNGAQKISKIFNWMGYKIPYADKGIESTMAVIMLDDMPGATVDVYNPWRALSDFIKNKVKYCSPEEAKELMDRIYAWAPGAIRKSAEKIKHFKQADGALSYSIKGCCPTKCGSPCGSPDAKEGDVNGTSCGSSALIQSIYLALNLSDYTVPVYSSEDLDRFLAIVEKRERDYFASKKA